MKNLFLKISACLAALTLTTNTSAQDSWSRTVSGGFGNNYNNTVFGMNVFNGQIYAAVGPDSGYVFRSASGNPNSWSMVFSSPISHSVDAINSSTVGGGNLYISSNSEGVDTSRVLRSTDGLNWTTYFMGTMAVSHIMPFQGLGSTDSIYLVQKGGLLHKSFYNSNDPLNALASWDTVFNFSLINPGAEITSIGKHNGKLFFGGSTGELYSSADGNNWSLSSSVGNGFGEPGNSSVTAICSYGGYLYIALENNSYGAQLWRTNDEVIWTKVQQFPSSNSKISSLSVASGKLWITANSYSGGLIWNTTDGTTYYVSNGNGFGDDANNGNYASITPFGNNIYWGGENYGGGAKANGFGGGAEIWRKCILTPPTVNLGPDQSMCPGSSITLNAGAGGVAYSWNNGVTAQTNIVTASGMYSVQYVGTNGCSAMDTISVDYLPTPVVNIVTPATAGNVAVCSSTSTNITSAAASNIYIADPPIHKTTNDSIADFLPSVLDTINVSGLSSTCSCNALMSVTIDSLYHTYSSDLEIGIYSPDGSYTSLANSVGGGLDNTYFGTEFRMNAYDPIAFASPPFIGAYLPMGDFQTLTGNPNGAWALYIHDNAGGDEGNLKGWTIRFKVDDTVMTYSWTPAAGLSSVNTLATTATPVVTTTYTLTATNSIGCAGSTTLEFDVADLIFAQAADTMCYGSSIQLTVQGGTSSTTWSPTADLSNTTGDAVTATPSVSTMYYVTDTIYGCPVSDSIYVYANSQIVLTSPASQTMCSNDTVTFTASTSGGSGPYSYYWDIGGTGYTGATIMQPFTTGTSFTITATDQAGCTASGGTSVSIIPSTDIYGNVSYSGGPVAGSYVVLYKFVPYLTHFDTTQVTITDAFGNYFFPSVDHSTYLIKVFPDSSYTSLVPTYFGDVFLWDSATVVSHDCSMADTFNIVSVEELGLSGPGFLQGTILEDYGFIRVPGDPVPGVDVKLGRNPGGQLVASTQTDTSGTYSFPNVAYGSYTIFADIPGLGRDSSYTVVVDSVNSNYLNLDYLVDSTVVFIVDNTVTGITPATQTASVSTFSVYPNPASGEASIEYTIQTDANVSLGIYNVLGVKLTDLVSSRQMPGTYKFRINEDSHRITSGMYFITLIINDKTETHRLVINK
jgi:hypothetical protein